jgi:hypothetical protein
MPSRWPFPGRLPARALLGVLLVLVPTALRAEQGKILEPGAGFVVKAGEQARVVWSELPGGVAELELLLSLDGGRSYSLRLTPQLEPERGGYTWRVPNLPGETARLRIRYGLRGREVEGPASASFVIVASSFEEIAPLRVEDGELWPARVPLPIQPRPSRGARAPAELRSSAGELTAEGGASDTRLTSPLETQPGGACSGPRLRAADAVGAPRQPRVVPLRR